MHAMLILNLHEFPRSRHSPASLQLPGDTLDVFRYYQLGTISLYASIETFSRFSPSPARFQLFAELQISFQVVDSLTDQRFETYLLTQTTTASVPMLNALLLSSI